MGSPPVQVGGDLLAVLGGEFLQGLLGHGQHAAGAAGAVVQQVGAGGDLVGDGLEDQLRHQPDRVARGPVLARLLVVLLVEAAHQLLEDRAHAVIVEPGMLHRAVAVAHRIGAQVEFGRGELLDQRAQGIGAGQPRNLVAELEVVEDVLHVGREPVEVGGEIGSELLAVRAGAQVPQGEAGGVVERLSGRLAQGRILLHHAGAVERSLHVEDRLLAALQHRVEAAQHGHRQDHVPVLATHVEIPQDIVGDAPYVVRDPVQVAVVRCHLGVWPSLILASSALRVRRAGERCIELVQNTEPFFCRPPRGHHPKTRLGVILRDCHGGEFLDELVNTHSPLPGDLLQPPSIGRQSNGQRRHVTPPLSMHVVSRSATLEEGFAPRARRFHGQAAEPRHRVADGTARHLRAQSPYHFDDVRRNLQAASRFRQALVVRRDDHLPLLRYRGEHTSQAVNLARGHRLDRIVDQDEAERERRSHDGAGVP